MKPLRDKLGRFMKKSAQRRDKLGWFVKKVLSKKVLPKKALPKKALPKKALPKKALPKKALLKKALPKKALPKKVLPKKALPKKALLKKALPKKALPKKVLPKKALSKKALPKKAQPKKDLPKKVLPKKALLKKALPKKALLKKALPKKALPKKVPPKKALLKKDLLKKVPPKKAPSKKALPKKALPRKVLPKKVPPKKVPPKKVLSKKVTKRPVRKVRRRRRRALPGIPERSRQAESVILAKLADLMEVASSMIEGADVAVKSFINTDGSVDGELKIAELPDELRSEEGIAQLVAILSEIFRAFRPFPVTPSMGGRFWVSFALRFGPQNETEVGQLAELYKRFRGLYQVGTYPAAAWHPTPIQLALTTGLKTIVEGVSRKQGFPPSVILVRFTWTPDGKRPGHLKGEAGGGR